MNKGLIAVLVVVAIVISMGIGGYNSLVTINEETTGKWSQVENQLQRRNDLIPNLVNTVQGFANHEKSLIQDVTDARSKMMGSRTPDDVSKANGELTGALSRLMVLVENYPQIKADTNFRQLADELAGTENRIAVARRDYNNAVQILNTKIKSFPTNIYASMFGFNSKNYFQVEDDAKKTPVVNFK